MMLAELLHPISPTLFFAEYWEKCPLLVAGEERGRFSGLFSSRDVGRLLHYMRPAPPEGMLLVKGSRHCDINWTHPDGSPRPDKVRAAWRDGYTIVVNALGRLWEPVAVFASSLQEDLHHPVSVNLYVTPAGTQAFDPHFDIMDVFILQVEGSKIWQVYGPGAHLPLPDEHTAVAQNRLPPLMLEEELKEGGVLYIPRGHVHAARTTSTASLHLTVSVTVVTWLDLFSAAVSAARQDERFRKALLPGFFHEPSGMREQFRTLLEELPRSLNLDDALRALAEKLMVSAPPPPGEDLLAEEVALGPDSILARRKGVRCRVVEGPGYAGIQYSGGKILGPAKIASALRYVAQHRLFAVRSVSSNLVALNDREILVLLRRLVRDGVLEVQ